MIELTLVHWIYVIMVLVILGILLMRKDIAIPCILGVFFIGLASQQGIAGSTASIFRALIVSATELLNIIMIISLIVAMSKLLDKLHATELMVSPFTKLVKTPDQAFWFIGITMLLVSWFFWPSPATPLIGAVLLPIAYKVGLPAIGAAVAINLFGHGVALSTDFVIQGAPALTANSAGVDITEVMLKGGPLFLVMSVVTVVSAYILLKRDIKNGTIKPIEKSFVEKSKKQPIKTSTKIAAILVPLAFLFNIIAMFSLGLRGGGATALIGGTAALVLVVLCIIEYKQRALSHITEFIREGFVFGMKIFGPIIPIAAFFFMGDLDSFASVMGSNVLPEASQGILADLGAYMASVVSMNRPITAIMEMIIGGITGLDGSGFSGIALSGSLARVFGIAVNGSIAVLGALGQISAVWIGGGTIIPWSGLIAVAAICEVSPMELARRNLVPVAIGLTVTTILAMFLI
ncbi:hypothetical protein CACET_c25600 [Clostridium aceticum]|uniref:Uncharacterized protein n=1 Tax=Clostridium aceticum TaxID=84022 RepID=A0A0D8I9T6_9CLOT|nr:hypothetical protein [Clostridium aceticum]AKL96005.1 hypothetical protein CACET_c25600 [Clostridium aceticum]KJF27055.1 membrane protein [Clostridium aceticum]